MSLVVPEGGLMLSGTRYRLWRRLGEGSFGDAWYAEDTMLGRPVVIKILKETEESESAVRFLREARILARIRHHGVVEIHDIGVRPEGFPFFVMEFIEGEVLSAFLRARGTVSVAEACTLLAHACDALAAAHAQGIVHRDVKPDNLLVTKNGLIKVIDFGIAKRIVVDEAGPTAAVTALGALLGTPRYLAPEQARGQPITPATDLYALGCVLYEVLTGRPPFEGPLQEVIRQHVQTPAPALSAATNLRFPPTLEALVARLLAKDPATRGDRADVVASELRAIAGDAATANLTIASLPFAPTERSFPPPALPPTASRPAPRRSSKAVPIAIAAAVVVLALIAAAIFIATRPVSTGSTTTVDGAKEAKPTATNGVLDAAEVHRRLEALDDWEFLSDAHYPYEKHEAHIMQLSKGKKRATVSVYVFRDPALLSDSLAKTKPALPDSTFVVRKSSFGIVTIDPTDAHLAKSLAAIAFADQ